MRAPRDILKHVNVEVAKRPRKCGRDKAHRIVAGQSCLVVKDGGAFSSAKSYCLPCGQEILAASNLKCADLMKRLA